MSHNAELESFAAKTLHQHLTEVEQLKTNIAGTGISNSAATMAK